MTNGNTFKNTPLKKVVRKLIHQIRKPVSWGKHTFTFSIWIFSLYYVTKNDILIWPWGSIRGKKRFQPANVTLVIKYLFLRDYSFDILITQIKMIRVVLTKKENIAKMNYTKIQNFYLYCRNLNTDCISDNHIVLG